jgi:hypothetical protein
MKEGVGETSGQTAGPHFSTGLALFEKPARQKKEVFFIGADPKVRNFTGALRQLRFGPDVFADALVPCRRIAARRFDFPKIAKRPILPSRGFMPGDVAAMVIALPNGRVNRIPQTLRQSSKTSVFADLARRAARIRSDSIHREA